MSVVTYLAIEFVIEENGDLAIGVWRDDTLTWSNEVAHRLSCLDLEDDVLVRLVDERQPGERASVLGVELEGE